MRSFESNKPGFGCFTPKWTWFRFISLNSCYLFSFITGSNTCLHFWQKKCKFLWKNTIFKLFSNCICWSLTAQTTSPLLLVVHADVSVPLIMITAYFGRKTPVPHKPAQRPLGLQARGFRCTIAGRFIPLCTVIYCRDPPLLVFLIIISIG